MDSPLSYSHALAYANQKPLYVYLKVTDETAELVCAIVVVDESSEEEFWMDARPSMKEAIELCVEMGWQITDDNQTE